MMVAVSAPTDASANPQRFGAHARAGGSLGKGLTTRPTGSKALSRSRP